ncbi:MAG TPA: hypothetical protein VL284_05810 [Thermoanaerobaculia bacterium]|nr:hypothetical protein [Thermoanaerobaculia bacterium]
MKTTWIALLLLISSASAFALETPPLLIQKPVTSRVQTNLGITQVHTKAANIRIAWLPLLAPLPYSYPRATQEIPNALVLTRTEIPERPACRDCWRHSASLYSPRPR